MIFLGWIGNILIVIGLWRIGSKKRDAFLWQAVGEVSWVVKSTYYEQWDLAFMCSVFTVLAVRCWFTHRPKKVYVDLETMGLFGQPTIVVATSKITGEGDVAPTRLDGRSYYSHDDRSPDLKDREERMGR